MKIFKKIITWMTIIIIVLFSYGLIRGFYDAHINQHSSILTMGITATAMNPLSRIGYKIGIHTNPEVQKKIDLIKNYKY